LNSKYASTITSLTILVTLSFIITVQVQANSTTVYVEPPLINIEVSQTCRINISISQVNDLAGWEFKLYYPNSILNATSIEEGPFLKSVGSTLYLQLNFTDYYNATHGLIWAACALQGSGPGANGNGTLATITFKAKSAGNAKLTLADTDLIDSQMPNPNHIPHSTTDGTIRAVWGLRDIAITDVKPLKTIVGQGYAANVNVTVENQGAYQETFNVTLYASRPNVGVVNIYLYGASQSTKNGWGFTRDSITSPGPTIIVKKGDIVNLTLTSVDGVTHNFFVDYNGDKIPNPGEPKSADFPAPPYYIPTINYKFTANTVGTFKYYSYYDQDIMNGTFIVIEPTIITTEIGTRKLTLDAGLSINVTFTWNTTGFAKGNYTIWAYAWPVQGETDTADNNMTSAIQVHVGVPGNIWGNPNPPPDYDGVCNARDITYLILHFNEKPPNWENPNADINNDLIVNARDVTIAVLNFMKTESDP
jgi:hypothetical protein